MNRTDIRNLLSSALAVRADEAFSQVGFTRHKPNGIHYARQRPGVRQIFDVTTAANPTYRRGALAHVYPRMQLEMDELSAVAKALVNGNLILLANAPDLVLNRPFEHFVPKESRVQWYAETPADFPEIASFIATQFVAWGVPFFDNYWSAEDVVRGYEAGDDRPRLQKNWNVFVVAAYVSVGQATQASAVAEKEFASIGDRKKYACVFENLPAVMRQFRDKPLGSDLHF